MEKEFTMRDLIKRGFVRHKEEDFRDDGNKFKIYYYKGLRISYLKDRDDYFLSIRIPYGNYIYDDYKDKDWYKLADEFNYCNSIDPDKVIQNCESILIGIKELEEEINQKPPVDIELLYMINAQEVEMAERVLEKFKSGNYIWNLETEYDMRKAIDYVKSLERTINRVKDSNFSEYNQRDLRELEARLNNYNYLYIKEDDYYIEQLNKIMEAK